MAIVRSSGATQSLPGSSLAELAAAVAWFTAPAAAAALAWHPVPPPVLFSCFPHCCLFAACMCMCRLAEPRQPPRQLQQERIMHYAMQYAGGSLRFVWKRLQHCTDWDA